LTTVLPTTTAERKAVPLATGVLDYFPAALAYVARISKAGNDKHNPGEEMHHARGKSMDHADCIARHLVDRGTVDPEDGLRHSGKIAWRALALLQEELEAAGEAPLARAARLPEDARVGPAVTIINNVTSHPGSVIPCGPRGLGGLDLTQLRLPLEGGGYTTPRDLTTDHGRLGG
jgi:hypothetical protein